MSPEKEQAILELMRNIKFSNLELGTILLFLVFLFFILEPLGTQPNNGKRIPKLAKSDHVKKMRKMSPEELVSYYNTIKNLELNDQENWTIHKKMFQNEMIGFILFEMRKRTEKQNSLKGKFYEATKNIAFK